MRIRIDYELCEANAACVKLAPQVFRLDDQDKLHLLVEVPTEEQRESVESAIRRCPRRALSLSET
jgi:ferredoxin